MKLAKDLLKQINDRHLIASEGGNKDEIAACLNEYSNLLNSNPQNSQILFLISTCLTQLGQNGLAINIFEYLIDRGVKNADLYSNLGSAWRSEFNHEKALEYFNKSLELRQDSAIYNNLSTLYINDGRAKDGLEFAEKAVQLDANSAMAKWNRGLLRLELQDYSGGFSDYEYGLFTENRPNRQFKDKRGYSPPYWEGQTEGTLVVYGEQGIGDEILALSCLGDLPRSLNIIVEAHPRLVGVIKRSFPWVTVYDTRKEGTKEWESSVEIDYRVAVCSLFYFFRRDGQFPKKPYLTPDESKVHIFKTLLNSLGKGPYIGIGYGGGSKRTRIAERSLKLNEMRPLLVPGHTYISLQYTEDADEKIAKFNQTSDIKIHHFPDHIRSYNYDDTIALIAALDLVVCVNTAAVHVCGAIGQTCFTLTPKRKAWRYCSNDEHINFYGPWVKQFIQSDPISPDDRGWTTSINKILEEIKELPTW